MAPVTMRLVEVGCEFRYLAEVPTPAVFQVEPLGQAPVVVRSAATSIAPDTPVRRYLDLYGNPCRRLVIPAGSSLFRYEALVEVPDRTEDVDPTAPELAPDDLPDDVLLYTLPSRYCLPDMLGNEAWSRFGGLPRGYSRVQAICDHVNGHLTFLYGSSGPTSTSVDVNAAGYGVCRDFTHLAITFCRALNIPARYVFGYLPEHGRAHRPGPHGLRRVDGGLARRPLVDLRPAQQPAPQGPHPHRSRARRLRRRDEHHLRRARARGDARPLRRAAP